MIQTLVERQKHYFNSGETKPYAFRKSQLLQLQKMLKTFEAPILKALKFDLNKSEFEAYSSEILFLQNEINEHLNHLKQWMAPTKVKNPLTHTGTKSYILKEPYGATLVIAPWNYPVHLAIAPVIGALAAGNTVILKPSELTPTVSWVLKRMVETYFPPEYFTVVEGEKETTQQLIDQNMDYIFFTGSTSVGRQIMSQASNYLTPVTLELGGKSPAIVDSDANLKLAAKRITWGKFTNAGQTCIAPDYVYVHEDVKQRFLTLLSSYIESFYGHFPLQNPDYTRIVNKQHFDRLTEYLHEGTLIHGGQIDEINTTIEPTVLDDITWDAAIMKDEIFGPILPIMTFEHMDEVMADMDRQHKPLALYYFGEDETEQRRVTEGLSFGGGCINDTLYHVAHPRLPFGGVGNSGMGAYHGKASFDTFTHAKSITKQTTAFDQSFRYPGSKFGLALMKKWLD
ncbi:aldehyde dehydrogenase [Thalassobacillus sp. CUG 92003]|uniref:aldehyde dehydrogenase n=1 Tax=Thalassobacillus sp. CUG 92003 TaxID=2736641 RepID=UPI0015E76FBE|nr:aldehyde dehydrogenase [Thalassobacillus sp. CUG 92003]